MIHRSAGLAGRLCHWSSRTPSPAVLIMLPGGCVPTGSSWTLRRLRSCGLLLVIVLINCRSHHFELALTKLCQLLSFVISMRLHVTKTVSACVAILRSVCWSVVRRSVLQSLVTSLVLTRLDHGNAKMQTSLYLLKWLQSVMNSGARLVFSSSRPSLAIFRSSKPLFPMTLPLSCWCNVIADTLIVFVTYLLYTVSPRKTIFVKVVHYGRSKSFKVIETHMQLFTSLPLWLQGAAK